MFNVKITYLIASVNDHLEIVKELVENGAQVNYKDENSQTALSYGNINRLKEIIVLIHNSIKYIFNISQKQRY